MVYVFRKFKKSVRSIPVGNPEKKATLGDAYDMVTIGRTKMIERDIKNDPKAMAAIGRYWEHTNNFRVMHKAFMEKMHNQYGMDIPDHSVKKQDKVVDVV